MGIRIDAPTGLPVPTRTDRGPRRKRQARVPGPRDVDQVDAAVLRDPGLHATPEDFGARVGRGLADFAAAAGRVATAHRQGARAVKQYLDHQRRHNWATDPKTFPKDKKDQFLSVETRLREFQKIPVLGSKRTKRVFSA